jgi:hypothetical protein
MKAKRTRRVAVELWLGKVSLAKIREQLQVSKATLKHVLAHTRAHPEQLVQKGKRDLAGFQKDEHHPPGYEKAPEQGGQPTKY